MNKELYSTLYQIKFITSQISFGITKQITNEKIFRLVSKQLYSHVSNSTRSVAFIFTVD